MNHALKKKADRNGKNSMVFYESIYGVMGVFYLRNIYCTRRIKNPVYFSCLVLYKRAPFSRAKSR